MSKIVCDPESPFRPNYIHLYVEFVLKNKEFFSLTIQQNFFDVRTRVAA